VEQMVKLSRKAAQLMRQVDVHAVTDITGFALLGHSYEVAELSEVGMRFQFDQLPFLEGATEYANDWLFPGRASCNKDAYEAHVRFAKRISDELQMLLFTSETSGGLLISVAAEDADRLADLFSSEGQQYWIVGEVVEGPGRIEVV
jgi:selenide,water dikinase